MIKNILFDIGNVLMHFDEYGHAERNYGTEAAEAIMSGLREGGIGDLFDRGLLPHGDIVKAYVDYAPQFEEEIKGFVDTIGDCMYPHGYAIPWIKELKELGYNVYYLSNWSDWFLTAHTDALSFLPYTDGGVFSHIVHLLKPEKEIYDCICDKYGLDPEECLFLDDRRVNVQGALDAGLDSIRFEGYEKSYPVIMEYLRKDRENGDQI